MSGRANNSPGLDLKLNLSPPRANNPVGPESSNSSSSIWDMSPESSCVSSEQEDSTTNDASSSPKTTASMVLVGCPRCLMYVMLSEVDPKCPKCKSTVLLDFFNEENLKKTAH